MLKFSHLKNPKLPPKWQFSVKRFFLMNCFPEYDSFHEMFWVAKLKKSPFILRKWSYFSNWTLNDFWMTCGRLLNDFLLTSSWLLNGFWMTSGWLLDDPRMTLEWHFIDFFMTTGWIWDDFSGWIWDDFWMTFECLMDEFQMNFVAFKDVSTAVSLKSK